MRFFTNGKKNLFFGVAFIALSFVCRGLASNQDLDVENEGIFKAQAVVPGFEEVYFEAPQKVKFYQNYFKEKLNTGYFIQVDPKDESTLPALPRKEYPVLMGEAGVAEEGYDLLYTHNVNECVIITLVKPTPNFSKPFKGMLIHVYALDHLESLVTPFQYMGSPTDTDLTIGLYSAYFSPRLKEIYEFIQNKLNYSIQHIRVQVSAVCRSVTTPSLEILNYYYDPKELCLTKGEISIFFKPLCEDQQPIEEEPAYIERNTYWFKDFQDKTQYVGYTVSLDLRDGKVRIGEGEGIPFMQFDADQNPPRGMIGRSLQAGKREEEKKKIMSAFRPFFPESPRSADIYFNPEYLKEEKIED